LTFSKILRCSTLLYLDGKSFGALLKAAQA
jgi:hypothetical protein